MGNAIEPKPVGLATPLFDDKKAVEHRRFDCRWYDRCLMYAAVRRWNSFSCLQCGFAMQDTNCTYTCLYANVQDKTCAVDEKRLPREGSMCRHVCFDCGTARLNDLMIVGYRAKSVASRLIPSTAHKVCTECAKSYPPTETGFWLNIQAPGQFSVEKYDK